MDPSCYVEYKPCQKCGAPCPKAFKICKQCNLEYKNSYPGNFNNCKKCGQEVKKPYKLCFGCAKGYIQEQKDKKQKKEQLKPKIDVSKIKTLEELNNNMNNIIDMGNEPKKMLNKYKDKDNTDFEKVYWCFIKGILYVTLYTKKEGETVRVERTFSMNKELANTRKEDEGYTCYKIGDDEYIKLDNDLKKKHRCIYHDIYYNKKCSYCDESDSEDSDNNDSDSDDE
jgi:hypothetical protein